MRFEFPDGDWPGASGSGLAFDRDLDDLRAARREGLRQRPGQVARSCDPHASDHDNCSLVCEVDR